MRRPFKLAAVALVGIVLLLATAPASLAQSVAPSVPARPPAGQAAPSTTPARPTSEAPRQELIDINTASADELQVLKGIGPARAATIVKGRPYRGKDELHRKDIVPRAVYEDIKDQIVARQ